MFNEGYAASSGDALVRGRELCAEAIRLGSILAALMPDEAEVLGLAALMLLQDSRRDARVDDDGGDGAAGRSRTALRGDPHGDRGRPPAVRAGAGAGAPSGATWSRPR